MSPSSQTNETAFCWEWDRTIFGKKIVRSPRSLVSIPAKASRLKHSSGVFEVADKASKACYLRV